MYDNYNYPLGADGPDAPWNQSDPDPISIDVCISQTLHKTTTIEVDDYVASEWEECEDGIHTGGIDYDTSDCDLYGAVDKQVLTPIEILTELPEVYTKLCDELGNHGIDCKSIKSLARLENLASASKDWDEDELEVVKE